MRPIKTVGYEGAALADFLEVLGDAGVNTLVDVRAVAVSRRKGFSKTALSEALAAAGIGYVHLRDLGDPKDGREAARAGYYGAFRRIYAAHLDTSPAKHQLGELALLAKAGSICLLCYEADATHCHRSMIVDALGETFSATVDHLKVGANAGRIRRKSRYSGEGRAAA